MQPFPPKATDLREGDWVRLLAPLWRGWYGTVAYVGCDRVEVELRDGSVIPFLPAEVEPAEQEARYAA